MPNRFIIAGCLVAACCTARVLSQAPDRAEIAGRVRDGSGAALPGVALELRDQATGHVRRTVSEESGDFLFPYIPPGSYTLAAELPGFRRLELGGVRLTAQQRLDFPLVLEVGAPSEVVTVTAEANRVDTTSPAIRQGITREEIKNLPIMTGTQGRGVLGQLALLLPGASAFLPIPVGGDFAIGVAINGSAIGGIGFYLDGADNTYLLGSVGGSASQGPNPDALEEFSLLSHTYKAEAGGHQAQVHWKTKSGGNRYHGMARALDLNPDLSARDFFDGPRRSLWTTSAYGLQLSGPVLLPRVYQGRNRTFFMFDFDRTRSRQQFPDRAVVPSEANRAGDFSALEESRWPRDPKTGAAFAGGRIPASRVSPQARLYTDEFIPRAPAGEEIAGPRTETPSGSQATTRLDHQFSTRDTVSATLFLDRRQRRWDSASTPSTIWEGPERAHNVAVHHTRNFSANTVHALLFGSTHWIYRSTQRGKLDGADLRRYGYNIRNQSSGPVGFPAVWFDGMSFDPRSGDYIDEIRIAHLREDLALTRKAHAFRLGFELRWAERYYLDSGASASSFTFSDRNPSGSGNGFADFLLGIPLSYSQGTDAEARQRRLLSALYVQDDLKIRSNWTLNLGLRYEINSVIAERDGNVAAFRAGTRSTVFPKAPAGMLFPGDVDPRTGSALGPAVTPPDHDNVGPRVGIAYSPGFRHGLGSLLSGGPGKSAVRAGYGIYYVLGRSFGVFDAAYLPPRYAAAQIDRAGLDRSGGTFADPWGSDPNPFPRDLRAQPFLLPVWNVPYVELDLVDAYQQQWSLSLERELPSHVTAEVAYVGSSSRHLLRLYEVNPGLLRDGATPFNVDARRLYPDFGRVRGYASDGASVYHGLQAKVSRRFASRLQGNAHYVWSKTLDDATGVPLGFADRDATPWGRANADRQHQFVAYGTWALPGPGRLRPLRWLLSDWNVTGTVQLRSGLPLLIRNAWDSTLRGVSAGMPDIVGPFTRLPAREVRTFKLPNGQTATGNFLIDPSVFQTVLPAGPGDARPGNLGRNAFTGPGVAQVDMSLLKRVTFGDRHGLELRIDATNVFNHAQFLVLTPPRAQTGSSQFGRTFGTLGPRRVQLYVRYAF